MNILPTPSRFSYCSVEQFLIDFRHSTIRLRHYHRGDIGATLAIHNGIDSHVHLPVDKIQFIQESEQAWDIVGSDRWRVCIFKNSPHLSISIQ